MPRFRLRYLSHDLEIPPGDFFMGRSPECQLALDDPLVSRKHAVLHVTEDGVGFEDLGSRNGILVNGLRVTGTVALKDGDKIGIGSQEMTLVKLVGGGRRKRPTGMLIHCQQCNALLAETDKICPVCSWAVPAPVACPACGSIVVGGEPQCPSCGQSLGPVPLTTTAVMAPVSVSGGRRGSAFLLLAGVAEKALALNRIDEAERILTGLFADLLAQLQNKKDVDPETLEDATRYALRLAAATGKTAYLDWIFEVNRLAGRLIAAPIVDEMYDLVRKVRYAAGSAFRGYLKAARDKQAAYGPTEKFLLQRIEGLERLCNA